MPTVKIVRSIPSAKVELWGSAGLTLPTAPPYSPASRTVSVATAEEWEKELLQDPKVHLMRPYSHLQFLRLS